MAPQNLPRPLTPFIGREREIAEITRLLSETRLLHNRGNFQGLPPTGKRIESGGITIERIKDGRIVERRVSADWLHVLQQLGSSRRKPAARRFLRRLRTSRPTH
jgi:hypothetical protein